MNMLQAYLSQLNTLESLGEEEERLLWAAYKDGGDLDSRYRLIEAHQHLVVRIVQGLAGASPHLMDLIQEGTVGLIEAVESFDPRRNVPFGAYAQYRIRGRVLNFFARERQGALPGSDWMADGLIEQAASLYSESGDPVSAVERDDISGHLRAAMNRLPAKEAQVISEVLIADRKPVSVAAEMHISESYLHKLRKRAIHRMRGMLSRLKAELTTPF
jgi:RNA polymerase sporulation-specific sigma factor